MINPDFITPQYLKEWAKTRRAAMFEHCKQFQEDMMKGTYKACSSESISFMHLDANNVQVRDLSCFSDEELEHLERFIQDI